MKTLGNKWDEKARFGDDDDMSWVMTVFADITLSGNVFQRVGAALENDLDPMIVLHPGIKRSWGFDDLDHVINVDILKGAHMHPMAEFLREKRLRWIGHVQRRDKDDATRKILQMTVDGKRNRGRPKNRTEQNRTLYFDREVSVHIYKYIHMYITYTSSYRHMMLCIN